MVYKYIGGNIMVDLRKKPYCLSDGDIEWVKRTIEQMTDEERVGQLFWQLTASADEEYLLELVEKYHVGGCRYNPMPAEALLRQNRILQKNAKIPLFIACNPERGGDGVCTDGTLVGAGIKVGATGKSEHAEAMGYVAGVQMAAVGCNMAFAPVVDILYNHECDEVLMRAFGSEPDTVARMGSAYMTGLRRTDGLAAVAKHFPGNGQDSRDAHISNNINGFGESEWMASYGRVYRTLIDGGLDAIMGGHIMMGEYMKDLCGEVKDEDIMPATLSYEIMTVLLRERLGFNGMVVTDASHMVAMTNRMKRRDMLPLAINAGCDMFLFFNDPDEDFDTMLTAYRDGVIPEWRIIEALTRILGLKAKMGLHKKAADELCQTDADMKRVINDPELLEYAKAVSRDAITLVKSLDKGVLPISPEKTKRIMIVLVKGAENPMMAFAKMAMGVGNDKKNAAKKLRDALIKRGFDAFIYESPIEDIKRRIEMGEKPSLNLYFAGKNAISDFVAGQDLVITLFDVMNGHPAFSIAKGGGEIPWYVHEIPVIGISVGKPTMLADCPTLRTYINAYDSNDDTVEALVDALVSGDFRGKDPIDSFCGMWDTRI